MEPIDFLLSGEYRMKFGWIQKETFGQLNLKNKTMVFCPEAMLAYLFIHEFLHVQYPYLSGKLLRGIKPEQLKTCFSQKTKRSNAKKDAKQFKKGISSAYETAVMIKTERYFKRMSKRDIDQLAKALLTMQKE